MDKFQFESTTSAFRRDFPLLFQSNVSDVSGVSALTEHIFYKFDQTIVLKFFRTYQSVIQSMSGLNCNIPHAPYFWNVEDSPEKTESDIQLLNQIEMVRLFAYAYPAYKTLIKNLSIDDKLELWPEVPKTLKRKHE